MRLASLLRILGDKTRLRILRVLLEESLNVGELTQVLGLAQPTVSKHLAALRRAALVEVVKTAGYSYYRVRSKQLDWLEALLRELAQGEDESGDLVRLGEVLKQRSEVCESADKFVVPGRSWVAWSRSLKYLLPALRVADFGCGDGAFTLEMAGWASKVFAIDSHGGFLKLARQRCDGTSKIQFLQEDMQKVSLQDGSVDLVVISQSLHYVASPQAVLEEAHRILAAPGRVLLLDLLPHGESWVVDELKHRWMGFEPGHLRRTLRAAGFRRIEMDTGTKQVPEPFRILIVTGVKEGD